MFSLYGLTLLERKLTETHSAQTIQHAQALTIVGIPLLEYHCRNAFVGIPLSEMMVMMMMMMMVMVMVMMMHDMCMPRTSQDLPSPPPQDLPQDLP